MPAGGARAGAGARPRGISEARRRIVRGIERGLARAARIAGCPGETEDELVVEVISEIVANMAAAGQGADLVKLYAATSFSADSQREEGEGSALERALKRLPGLARDTNPAPELESDDEHQEKTVGYSSRTTDTASCAHRNAPAKAAFTRPRLPGQASLFDGITGAPLSRDER